MAQQARICRSCLRSCLKKAACSFNLEKVAASVLIGTATVDDADGVAPMYDNIKHARYEFDAAFW